MPRRSTGWRGVGASTIRRTRGGRSVLTLTAALDGDEYVAWLVCYRAVLSGAIAAQRRLPEPKMMARWAATMADAAYAEAAQRRRGNGAKSPDSWT